MNFIENAVASNALPCPVCGKTDWCFMTIDSAEGLIQAVCGRPVQSPPPGWIDTGTRAKDGRVIYRTGNASTAHRKRFPKRIEWRRWDLQPGPEWLSRPAQESFDRGDKVRRIKGKDTGFYLWEGYLERGKCRVSRDGVVSEGFSDQWELLTVDGEAKELEVTYLYPDADGRPVGRVRRRQWSDRRSWYERDSLKTKEIRPFHAVKTTDPEHPWVWKLGRGEQTWPLYRQREALDAIDRGEPVFVVAGEQAVEVMARQGFVAVSPQGGENRQGDVITNIGDHLKQAYRLGSKPILLLWPDADPTGQRSWAELQQTCNNQDILAATLSPTECWAEMPDGGDVADMFRAFRGAVDQLRTAIITAAEQAIDRQERILKAAQQRKHWGAPEERGSELGFFRTRKARKTEHDSADDDGLISYWQPKTDFNFKVVRELIGADGGGLQLAVKLADYRQERRLRVGTEDCSTKARFQGAIAKGVGRNVICNLKDEELQALMRVRLLEYRLFEDGMSFRLAERIGRQPDGHWIFPARQFSPAGEETQESRSGWVWNDELSGGEDNISPPEITTPSREPFLALVRNSREFFKQNWAICLLTLGYVAAGCHYEQILKTEEAFPVLDLFGDMGCGKTQIAKTALAIIGHHKSGVMAETTISAAYERLKITGSLAICLDDPKRDAALSSFFKSLYGGESRNVRGGDKKRFNVQKPRSPLFFTSNMALGEDHQAARSRLIKIFVPRVESGDSSAWLAMDQARELASGIFPELIKMTYDPSAVREIEHAIAPHLNLAHDRLPRSFALLLYYTQKVAALAGDTTDVIAYCAEHVFPRLNTAEEAGDSLLDFVEKVLALKTAGEVGPWNIRVVAKLGSRALAINLPSVWPVVERNYKLPYDQGNLKAVIEARGGNLKATHQFHADRNESLSCIKNGSKARKTTQRCCEIPLELLAAGNFIFGNDENDVNDVNGGWEQPSNPGPQATTSITTDVNGLTKDVNGFTSLPVKGEGLDPLQPSLIYTDLHRSQAHLHDVNGCDAVEAGVPAADLHHLHHLHPKTLTPDLDQQKTTSLTDPACITPHTHPDLFEVPRKLGKGDRLWGWQGDRWAEAVYLGKKQGSTYSMLTRKLGDGIRVRWVGGLDVAIALEDCRVSAEMSAKEA
jgi:hypothetical protein